MRFRLARIGVICAAASLTAIGHRPKTAEARVPPPISPPQWTRSPIPRAMLEIALLNALANDPMSEPEARMEAIYILFARHLGPPADALQVASVIVNPTWLTDCRVESYEMRGGSGPPLPFDERFRGRCTFGMFFKFEGQLVGRIFVRVSGLRDAREKDFVAFLSGAVGRWSAMRIEEFLSMDAGPWVWTHYRPSGAVRYP